MEKNRLFGAAWKIILLPARFYRKLMANRKGSLTPYIDAITYGKKEPRGSNRPFNKIGI